MNTCELIRHVGIWAVIRSWFIKPIPITPEIRKLLDEMYELYAQKYIMLHDAVADMPVEDE